MMDEEKQISSAGGELPTNIVKEQPSGDASDDNKKQPDANGEEKKEDSPGGIRNYAVGVAL